MSLAAITQSQDQSTVYNATIGEAIFAYLKTTKGMRNLALDAFGKIGEWTTLFRPSKTLSGLSEGAKEAKSWVSLADIPEQIVQMVQQAHSSLKERTVGSFAQFFNKVCGLVVSVTEVADPIHQRVYPMSERTVKALTTAGYGAFAVTSMFDVADNVDEYNQASETVAKPKDGSERKIQHIQTTQAFIKGIGAISDVALGVLGVLSYMSTLTVAPWVLLALATNSLVCVLGAQFYPQIHAYSYLNNPLSTPL
jgi:hypothetical protein